MTPAPPGDGARRVAALDGLRGAAIVMVVLGHSWLIWPSNDVTGIPYVRGPFVGGTVTVFFVVGGYVVARGLLRELDRDTCDPLRFYLRRLVRLGPQLVLVCLVAVVLSVLDPASGDREVTRASALHVLTYTWNIYLEQDPANARPDLGHLWYLSVQQQLYLLLPLVLVLFGRARVRLAAVLCVVIVAMTFYRASLLDEMGYWVPSLRTATRGDGLLTGVVLALLLPLVPGFRRLARPVFWVSVVAMLGLVAVAGEVGEYPYLRWWGTTVMVVSAVLVAAIVEHPGGRGIGVLGSRVPRTLGRASYSTYVWHYPLFWFMARHTADWAWQVRLPVTLAVLAAIVFVMERVVEEPLRRLLATNPTFRLPARTQVA
jgi:peptidoglycan/LPS O-acetylase OafA/YrhL